MKRFLCLALTLCLLLCGCGGKAEETTATTVDTTPVTEEPTTVPTTVPETTEPVIYQHPLNGQLLDQPWTNRATAVVINNIKAALPQYGISKADVIYEIETEGGITRLLTIFSDVGVLDTLGPVRSDRTFFSNVALSHDAVLIHCGGSSYALNGQYAKGSDSISNWEHIDQTYNGSYFYRDQTRLNSGFALEHTLFTKGESLLKGLSDKGFKTVYEGDSYNHGLRFAETPALTGEAATSVTVTFRGTKTSSFQFDTESGLYLASQYGSKWMDAGVGEQLAFRNVVVLYADQSFVYDGHYNRSFYDLSGTGDGHLICDGTIVPITWHRDSLRSAFYYTLEDGTPVTLGTGNTYVGVVALSRQPVKYE